jgi:6-phosphogluconolactonase
MTRPSGDRRIEVLSGPRFAELAAARIAGLIASAVARRGECCLALSGGTTPEPVYRHLAGDAGRLVPWERVQFYFGDERAVPPDDPLSNYATAAGALLNRIPIRAEQVYRMRGEATDLAGAAEEYARSLPSCFDVLLLGMGEDGHTASLFPGSPALAEARLVVAVDSPLPPGRRLSITPPVIAAAVDVVILVRGPAKAAMLARVIEGPPDPARYPVQLAARGLWLVDEAAAADIT